MASQSDYGRCPTCHRFDWLKSHECPPAWNVWREDRGHDRTSLPVIHAVDAEQAVEWYAEHYMDTDDYEEAMSGVVFKASRVDNDDVVTVKLSGELAVDWRTLEVN